MAIKGLFSGRYLAMNKRGRLYASVSPISHVGRRGWGGHLPRPLARGQRGRGRCNALSGDLQNPSWNQSLKPRGLDARGGLGCRWRLPV